MNFQLVGASFRPAEAKAVLKELEIGDEVDLRAEPTNPYDAFAVAVDYEGEHIGYVPRGQNFELSEVLNGGAQLTATLTAFPGTLKPTFEVEGWMGKDDAGDLWEEGEVD